MDVFTRFSFLNKFIIAQKKRKVKPYHLKVLRVLVETWTFLRYTGKILIIYIFIKRIYTLAIVLLGAFVLTGCETPEVRQEKAIQDGLDFSQLNGNGAANTPTTAPASKGAPAGQPLAPPSAPTPPPTNKPVTSKKMYTTPPAMTIDVTKKYSVTLKTSVGDIVMELYAKETPITVNNFVFLAKEKFYDGTIFHRTIPGFMIQGGDPGGNGLGGPGYKFANEPVTKKYDRGIVAMANAGLDTNGSQFFIMQKDYPLPANYTIFGMVTKGLDVVDKIVMAPTKPGGEGSTPLNPVTVEGAIVSEQ